ncbi:hypothetical protein PG987_003414 [Apiospora arundinis]
MTTSTVYTTKVGTITACPATVTNCPVGSVTTQTIALYTTVCPVSGITDSPKPTSIPATIPSSTTITRKITNVWTITSCAPTVTDCPVGKLTSSVRTKTTVVPVVTPVQSTTKTLFITKTWTITSCAPNVVNCPVGSVTSSVRTKTTVVPVITPGGNGGAKTNVYSVVGPSANGGNGGSNNGKTTTVVSTAQKTIQIVSSAASTKVDTAVYVTATVVPVVPSAPASPNKNNGTASATPSKPVTVPVGTPAAGCTGSACKITASSGVRNGVTSAAVVLVAALFAIAY